MFGDFLRADYKFRFLARDTLPFALAALGVMVFTWFLTQQITLLPLLLAVRVVVAGVLYLGIMKLANVDVFNEMLAFVMRKRG